MESREFYILNLKVTQLGKGEQEAEFKSSFQDVPIPQSSGCKRNWAAFEAVSQMILALKLF